MTRNRTLCKHLLAGASLAAMALLVGCPGTDGTNPIIVPPVVAAASVTTPNGLVVQNQANTITVTATVVDISGTTQAVAADLSQIGGPAAQPLVFDNITNTWSSSLAVTPTVVGTRRVTITATDSNNRTGSAVATVSVTSSGGSSTPPTLSNPTVIGSPISTFASQIAIAVTVISPTSTAIQVVIADLSAVGGLPNQLMTVSQQNPNVWVASVVVIPPSPGTFTVSFQATDILGGVGTTSTTVVVNAPTP